MDSKKLKSVLCCCTKKDDEKVEQAGNPKGLHLVFKTQKPPLGGVKGKPLQLFKARKLSLRETKKGLGEEFFKKGLGNLGGGKKGPFAPNKSKKDEEKSKAKARNTKKDKTKKKKNKDKDKDKDKSKDKDKTKEKGKDGESKVEKDRATKAKEVEGDSKVVDPEDPLLHFDDLSSADFKDVKKRTWRGNRLVKLPLYNNMEVPRPGKLFASVAVDWPPTGEADGVIPLKPYSKKSDIWDGEHVRMPFSDKSQFPKESASSAGQKKVVNRWNVVKEALGSKIKTIDDLERRVLTYNVKQWTFGGLKAYVEDLENEEKKALFENLLPKIIDYCLMSPERLTKPVPLLRQITEQEIEIHLSEASRRRKSKVGDAGSEVSSGHPEWVLSRSNTFSQSQLASMLANAFFCTYPRRNSQGRRNSEYFNYPDINFNRLFSDLSDRYQAEKFKCLFNYFRIISQRDFSKEQEGLVTFQRRCVGRRALPHWGKSKKPAAPRRVHIDSNGTIEDDGFRMAQVDFANAFIGGGVLGHGCVQEEIRFLLCPELIAARLFTERLGDNECLIITGAERFSNYKGYGNSFEFTGTHEDETPIDPDSLHRLSKIVAIDAIRVGAQDDQYSERWILRELNKAYVGFHSEAEIARGHAPPAAIATGNWGCGSFGGDLDLKALIQMMAASECGRDVAYFTFGDTEFRDRFADLLLQMRYRAKAVTVGELYRILTSYWKVKTKTSNLFDYVIRNISYDIDTEDEEEFAEMFIMAEEAQARQEVERHGIESDEFDEAVAVANKVADVEQRSINTEQAQVRLTFQPKGGKEVKIYVTKSDVYTKVDDDSEKGEGTDAGDKAKDETVYEDDSEKTEAVLKKLAKDDKPEKENK